MLSLFRPTHQKVRQRGTNDRRRVFNLGTGGLVSNGPADPDLILQSLRDNDGQIVLDFIGPKVVDPEPEYTGVNCLAFDGIDNVVSYSAVFDPSYIGQHVIGFRSSTAGQTKYILHNGSGGTGGEKDLAILFINGVLSAQIGASAEQRSIGTANQFLDGEWHWLMIDRKTTTWDAYIDDFDTPIATDIPATTAKASPAYGIRVGARSDGAASLNALFFSGDVCCLKIAGVLNSPMSNQLPYDVSGNGNDAISSTGVLTTADGIPSYNLLYGCTPSIIGDGSGQCINFGIIPDATTKIELTFANNVVSGAFRPMIGCFNGGLSARFSLARTSSGFVYYYSNISNVSIAAQDVGVRHTATLEYDLATFDGVEYPFTSLGLSGATTPIQMYCIDWNGVEYNEYLESFRVRIWHQGALAVDAIPINDGQFYDKVTKTIIGNSGTGNLVNEYYPALKEPTVAVATFDGVADKLLVPEITGSETLGYSGSAALRLNAGEITAFSGLGGTAYNITINGELVYRITDLIGKTNTTIPSLSENYSDAQVVTGAGGLDAFWARRIEDTVNGVWVDAEYEADNLIYGRTQYGPMIHNGCEVKITQQDADFDVFGAGDTIYGNGVDTWNDVAWSDYKLHPNGSMGGYGLWGKDANGNCILERFDQYDKDYAPTPTGYLKNLNFYKTGTCGAAPLEAVTDSGEIVTDNGLVVFDGGA